MNPVLITSGGCEEAIDGVRSVGNFSTGRTGAFLAEYFAGRGADVLLFKAEKAVRPEQPEQRDKTAKIDIREFKSFSDLQELLEKTADAGIKPAMIIFAAAVSDFGVAAVHVGDKVFLPAKLDKLDSGSEERISVELKKHPKLIKSLKTLFPGAVIIGFKLTRNAGEAERVRAVEKLFGGSSAEYAVSNDLSEISPGQHLFRIYANNAGNPEQAAEGRSKEELAAALYALYNLKQGRRTAKNDCSV